MEVTVIRRWLCACVWSLVGAGCFTDAPVDGQNMIGQTAGDGCREGSSGCECYGNGTCDAGLSCAEGADVCVPTGCEPGTEHCVCGEGSACDDELECNGVVCETPGESSTTDPMMSSSSPITSSDSDDDDSTTDTTTTEPDTDSSASVADTSSSSSSSSTTATLEDCGELGCNACTECVVDPGQPCADLAETCEGLAGCWTAAVCLRDCGVTGICGACCEGLDGDAAAAAAALTTCRSDECITACGGWSQGNCTP